MPPKTRATRTSPRKDGRLKSSAQQHGGGMDYVIPEVHLEEEEEAPVMARAFRVVVHQHPVSHSVPEGEEALGVSLDGSFSGPVDNADEETGPAEQSSLLVARQTASTTATFERGTELVEGSSYVTLKSVSRYHVSQVLSEEFVDLKFSDALFRCSDGEVKTHKVVLASLSTLLRRALRDVANEDEAVVVVPDVAVQDLVSFLGKVYEGGSERVDIARNIAYIGFTSELDTRIKIAGKQELMEEDMWEQEDKRYTASTEQNKRRVKRKVTEKYSLIWNYFDELGHDSIAECLECHTCISTRFGKTSGMILHLKRKHPKRFKHFAKAKRIQLEDKQRELTEPSWSYDISYDIAEDDANNIAESIVEDEKIITEEKKETITQLPVMRNFTSVQRSPAWSYFRKSDQDKADCLNCQQKIDVKRGKTSGMIRHLKSAHPECFDSMMNSKRKVKDTLQVAVEESIGSIQEEASVEEETVAPPGQTDVDRAHNSPEHILVGKRSIIWNHFEEIDGARAKCLKCEKTIAKKAGSTSNMFRHLRKCQGEKLEEMAEQQATTLTTIIEEPPEKENEEVVFVPPVALKQEVETDEPEDEELVRPNLHRSTGKRSAIWTYFDPTDDVSLHKCKLCGKAFSSKLQKTSNMIRHLQNQHPEEYEIYAREAGQIPLMRKQRPKKPKQPRVQLDDSYDDLSARTCPECLKLYSTPKSMRYHLQVVHSGIRPFTCELCGASFARKSIFRAHHHNTDSTQMSASASFLCTYCGKTFNTLRGRARHEMSHVGVRKHQCSYCDKKFISTQQKTNHELVHTGLKTFSCGHCGKQFAREHQLKSHERIHTGEKPYKCPRCNEQFRHLSTRNSHKCFSNVIVKPEREYISIQQLTNSKKRKRKNI